MKPGNIILSEVIWTEKGKYHVSLFTRESKIIKVNSYTKQKLIYEKTTYGYQRGEEGSGDELEYEIIKI